MSRHIYGKNFAEAYKQILQSVLLNPDHVTSPRGQKTNEIRNLVVEIEDTTDILFFNKERGIPARYLAGELIWYFSGRDDLEFISKYSSFWDKISDNGKCNSAYGNLLFTEKNSEGISEWEWAREALIADEDSRQAIVRFNNPVHSYKGNKDFVCTLTGIFSIRDGKLDFTVTMRSNDVFFGMTFDYPFFMLLQHQMRCHLLKYYPYLQLGKFTHFIVSAHMYERNFKTCRNMLKYDFIPTSLPPMNMSLVCPDGSQTEEMEVLISALENKTNYVGQSDLYGWLWQNAKDK